MYTTRQLTTADTAAIKNLVQNNLTILNGYSDERQTEHYTNLDWLDKKDHFVLGGFADQKLVALISVVESIYSPSWYFEYYNVDQKFPLNLEFLPLTQLMDEALFLEMEEKRKLNRIFLTYPVNNPGHLKSIGMSTRLLPLLQKRGYRMSRYYFFTDCIVPANQLPFYEYQKAMLGHRTFPFDVAIRCGVLKF